ncbi:UDP-4-amino-4,6-dideoxy-N-acetyl-beta-L-altrosamine transaminase [Candidatus Puniceispirillum sp.]|nr:UDP-4-amino-4,6-dideoxy-N-acetyl-beta-L-altrosamine transaminase [Candidatus Puniceispirillum sp.]
MKNSKIIPYACQDIDQSDIDAVTDVLKAEFLTQGPKVEEFENSVSSYCGANYAIAVNSATSGLQIACQALGIGPGSLVWTSTITFAATPNCVLNCGARVNFLDVSLQTYNVCLDDLENKLIDAEIKADLPDVVIAVHMAGSSCDMSKIHQLAIKYGFKVIEDASHAIGGFFDEKPVGSCDHSDITVFSFHPVKIITSGEGGMAVTNDPVLASRMKKFRSHGISSDPSDMLERPKNEIWNYQQVDLGFNFRMTDMQAALGLSQIARIDEFVAARRRIAKKYDDDLKELPLNLPKRFKNVQSSYHLYIIRIKLTEVKKSQPEVFDFMRKNGVMVNLHYIPCHLQPYYAGRGFKRGAYPNAEQYFQEVISLPLFPHLSSGDQERCIELLSTALS